MRDDRAAAGPTSLPAVSRDWQPFLLLDGPVHFAGTFGQYRKPQPEPNVVVLCDYPPLDGDDPPLWLRSWFHTRRAKLDFVLVGEPLHWECMNTSQRENAERVVASRQGSGPLLVVLAPSLHHLAELMNWLLYRQQRT